MPRFLQPPVSPFFKGELDNDLTYSPLSKGVRGLFLLQFLYFSMIIKSIPVTHHQLLFGVVSMRVEVKLFANLAKLLPPGSQKKQTTVIVRKGTTVNQLLDKLNIPSDFTNVVMVNGVQQDKGVILSEGDVISMFPPIVGG
jgi:molybdopterin converting factor small subunit